MKFSVKQKSFGVLGLEKSSVKVFESRTQNSLINVGKEVSDAKWTGDCVTIWTKNGEIRRYKTLSEYENIR